MGGQLTLLERPEIDFVDERGGRQRVIGRFAVELAARDPAQLVVHQRDQAVDRLRVARAPFGQTPRHLSAHTPRQILAGR